MTNYKKLVKALRCKRDDCEGCDLAFFDNDEGWMCQYAAKDDDAADAIERITSMYEKAEMDATNLTGKLAQAEADVERLNREIDKRIATEIELSNQVDALQAEQKKTVTQIFCEEQMAWEGRCKDLMKHISDLQTEIRESMQKCAECGDAQEQKVKGLQAEVERLKDSNEELREKQTFIDHYGTEWMTSAKDVPTAAYEHGYADGKAEERAKIQKRNSELHAELEKWVSAAEKAGEPKRGEWIDSKERMRPDMCSVCGCIYEADRFMDKIAWNFCTNCGAKMTEV